MEIRQFTWNVVDSNSWLLIENNSGLLIDAVENEDLFKAVNSIDDLAIILTHCHFDHIIGLNTLRRIKPGLKVISTKLCSEYIGNSSKNTSNTATIFLKFYKDGKKSDAKILPFVCSPSDETFSEEYNINWQGYKVYLKSVHGHSSDSLIAIVDDRFLFSGDTLLSIPTVTRLRTGSTRLFWEEDIPLLKGLKNTELVYPGHGRPGKLKEMLETNKIPERYSKDECAVFNS